MSPRPPARVLEKYSSVSSSDGLASFAELLTVHPRFSGAFQPFVSWRRDIHRSSPPQPPVIPDPCVRCNWCAEACPTRLRPAGVLEAAQYEDVALAERHGVDACIECGICSYVCPSHLPLLDGVRRIRALRGSGVVTSTTIHVK